MSTPSVLSPGSSSPCPFDSPREAGEFASPSLTKVCGKRKRDDSTVPSTPRGGNGFAFPTISMAGRGFSAGFAPGPVVRTASAAGRTHVGSQSGEASGEPNPKRAKKLPPSIAIPSRKGPTVKIPPRRVRGITVTIPTHDAKSEVPQTPMPTPPKIIHFQASVMNGYQLPGLPGEEVERIFLSGAATRFNPSLLEEKGITHVLQLCPQSGVEFWGKSKDIAAIAEANIYRVENLPDSFILSEKVHELIDPALEWVQNTLTESAANRVLFHCHMGHSRAPATVVSYLMSRHNMSRSEAIAFVKAQRPTAEPNASIVNAYDPNPPASIWGDLN